MFLASLDYASLSASTSGAPLACLLMALTFLVPALLMGFVAQLCGPRMMVAPVGIFRIARDQRSYIQVGRVCHFGRRGETEASLRARLSEVL